jgi:hypothetical protein
MKLCEIENLKSIKKSNTGFNELYWSWKDLQRRGNIFDVVGKLNNFEIQYNTEYISSFYYGDKYYSLYDKKQNQYAMIVHLSKFKNKESVLEVDMVGVENKYKGLNLSVKLYAWLIKNKSITLVSGRQQSPGGRSIWERLAKVPGIFMFGFNILSEKSFQIEQNDLFNEDIYDDELQKEADYLYREYNATEKEMHKIENSDEKEYKRLRLKCSAIDEQLDKINDDVRLMDSIVLVATKNKRS